MNDTGQEKTRHWLWDFSLFLPKNSVRAIGFLLMLAYLGYFGYVMKGDVQNMIVGAIISIATTAAHLYYKAKEEEEKE